MIIRLLLLVFCLGLCRSTTLAAAETGQIAGQLADTNQQITYAGEVVVFLCDAKSGRPILSETHQPVPANFGGFPAEKFWHAITDETGSFVFQDVPVGQYRLVAQSWSGTKGLPKIFGKTSAFLILHGVAEQVVVKAGEKVVVFPRQLGNGTLHLKNDPAEAHAFLLLSLKPTMGDAILGPSAWGDEFISQVIGVTHMEQPHVTICGLPEHRDVHVALFNYDNSPGVGTGSYKAGQREGTLRIVAYWSNGQHEPPAELKELTDRLETKKATLNDFLNESEKGKNEQELEQRFLKILREDPRREVEVAGLGKRRLVDVVAALSYVKLRAQFKK
jgi:hypothetical protein